MTIAIGLTIYAFSPFLILGFISLFKSRQKAKEAQVALARSRMTALLWER